MAELVPDPGFDNPSAWDITTQEGSAVVSGGVLTCTEWRGTIRAVGMVDPTEGELSYEYEYTWLGTSAPSCLAVIQYGNTGGPLENGIIWVAGAGGDGGLPTSGTMPANGGVLNIATAFGPANFILGRVSIRSAGGYLPKKRKRSLKELKEQLKAQEAARELEREQDEAFMRLFDPQEIVVTRRRKRSKPRKERVRAPVPEEIKPVIEEAQQVADVIDWPVVVPVPAPEKIEIPAPLLMRKVRKATVTRIDKAPVRRQAARRARLEDDDLLILSLLGG